MLVIHPKAKHKQRSLISLSKLNSKATMLHTLNILRH